MSYEGRADQDREKRVVVEESKGVRICCLHVRIKKGDVDD